MSIYYPELNVTIKEEDIESVNGTTKDLESAISNKEEELVSMKKCIRVLESEI